ncbi:MAG TPA: hypothetical protein VF364_06760 [Candidatus Limnocylindria bacterium]
MTEVNGLRLAYRGLIAGLAGGYVWTAIAMLLSAVVDGDPLLPLRPVALALSPLAGSPELAFVLGLGAVQAGGALVGICFAYFFARFFTVRATLAIAAPAIAMLAWGLAGTIVARDTGILAFATHPIPVFASLGYGLLLGAAVPVRGEVTRYAGSPST